MMTSDWDKPSAVQAHLRHASITTNGNIYVQEIPESVRSAVNRDEQGDLGLDHPLAHSDK